MSIRGDGVDQRRESRSAYFCWDCLNFHQLETRKLTASNIEGLVGVGGESGLYALELYLEYGDPQLLGLIVRSLFV